MRTPLLQVLSGHRVVFPVEVDGTTGIPESWDRLQEGTGEGSDFPASASGLGRSAASRLRGAAPPTGQNRGARRERGTSAVYTRPGCSFSPITRSWKRYRAGERSFGQRREPQRLREAARSAASRRGSGTVRARTASSGATSRVRVLPSADCACPGRLTATRVRLNWPGTRRGESPSRSRSRPGKWVMSRGTSATRWPAAGHGRAPRPSRAGAGPRTRKCGTPRRVRGRQPGRC